MKGLSRAQALGGILAVVVAAAVAAGLFLLGSPADRRARRLDERRVQDLAGIARAVDLHWTRLARLPSSLDELQKETGANLTSADPATNSPYEFRPLQGETYELCAQFERQSRESDRGFWSHTNGRQCFRREALKIR